MKKIILILTVLTVLLFTGCDDMLEVFYPEFADDYNSTNNILGVEYYYTVNDIITNNTFNSLKPLMMELYNNGETPEFDIPVASIEVWGEYSYYFEFFVPQGSYDVWIWQDTNESGQFDSGDFVLDDDINGVVPNYYFSGGDEYMSIYRDTWTNY